MSGDITRKYAELFSSEAGKEVLEDLQRLWKRDSAGVDHGSLAFVSGQRSIMREIEDKIKKGMKE